ncbi:MAG: hypothetical protein Q4G13_06835 [Moraxella sp.]|nr:hypothetical protein [Moraxella sp.]
MKRKAIIIGGTGRVGQALTRELSSLYETVIVVGRTQPKYFGSNMYFYAVADFGNLSDTLAAIALDGNCDAFCCLWADDERIDNDESLYKIHYEYPLLFAKMCYEKGIRRMFLLSIAGADVRSDDGVRRAKGQLEMTLAGLGFEMLIAFWVSRLTLPTADYSLKGLGKKAMRFIGRIVPQDTPLTPAQVGANMALVAFRTWYDVGYVHALQGRTMPVYAERIDGLEHITHREMLAMVR